MNSSRLTRHRIFWDAAIIISTIIAIGSTIYSLTHGIYEVYPFLYFLPLILFVNFYPEPGVIFSLALSTIYLLLVYFFGNFNPALVAVSTGWFVIFVTIGFVTSSFAEGLRSEERKYREIFENSQAGILTFHLLTQRIQAINSKCAQMLGYGRQDLIDKELNCLFPDSESTENFITQIKKTSEIGDVELLLLTRDGVVRFISSILS